MQNLNVLPVSTTVGDIDDLMAVFSNPPYIVAEGLLVAYYGALSSVTGYSIAVGIYPERGYDSLTNDDNITVNIYRKSTKNQFQKKGTVILPGAHGEVDHIIVSNPTAVYNAKEKKFMVYYLATAESTVTTICLATGSVFNQLNKYGTVSGIATPVISAPGATTITAAELKVIYNKEENLYKVYYQVTSGATRSMHVSTSVNGYNF